MSVGKKACSQGKGDGLDSVPTSATGLFGRTRRRGSHWLKRIGSEMTIRFHSIQQRCNPAQQSSPRLACSCREGQSPGCRKLGSKSHRRITSCASLADVPPLPGNVIAGLIPRTCIAALFASPVARHTPTPRIAPLKLIGLVERLRERTQRRGFLAQVKFKSGRRQVRCAPSGGGIALEALLHGVDLPGVAPCGVAPADCGPGHRRFA